MGKHPLISVIIPNYNNQMYLKNSIDSVVNQTYPNIEIIVIDDCSTDSSWELLTSLLKLIDNLTIYKNDRNKGVSYSRNRGIYLANGEYITTLDPDDLFYLDKVKSEYNVFVKYNHKNIVAYSSYTTFTKDLHPITRIINQYNSHEGDIYLGMLYRVIPFSRDILIKKNMFYEVGGFNENLNLYEDWDFKLRLAKKYKYYYSGSDGIKYRQHNSGLSSVDFKIHITTMIDIFLSNAPNGKVWLFNFINQKHLHIIFIKKIIMLSRLNRLFK